MYYILHGNVLRSFPNIGLTSPETYSQIAHESDAYRGANNYRLEQWLPTRPQLNSYEILKAAYIVIVYLTPAHLQVTYLV